MKAIIPAAGIGKRLQPHTYNRPKVMVPLAGKPILEHISISLFKAGFDEISVIVGYKKETIIDYFNKKYPGHFKFPVQEEMKGLGHAILYGLEDIDEPVLIILGDTIIDLDISLLKDTDNNVIAVVDFLEEFPYSFSRFQFLQVLAVLLTINKLPFFQGVQTSTAEQSASIFRQLFLLSICA